MLFAAEKKITIREPLEEICSTLNLGILKIEILESKDKGVWLTEWGLGTKQIDKYNLNVPLESVQCSTIRAIKDALNTSLTRLQEILDFMSPQLRVGDIFTCDGIKGQCQVHIIYEGRNRREIVSQINGQFRNDYEHDLVNVEIIGNK
jgi:hypothetical protein